MEISKQVISLETAKKLSELYGKFEISQFFYINDRLATQADGEYYFCFNTQTVETFEYTDEIFDAFTVAELLDIMPVIPHKKTKDNYGLIVSRYKTAKDDVEYYAEYSHPEYGVFADNKVIALKKGDNLPDTLAQLLIKLLENNLITPDEINKN